MGTSDNFSEEPYPLWMEIMDRCQLAVTLAGFVANTFTVFVFHKIGNSMSSTMKYLLQHQAVVDSLVCAMAGIILVSGYVNVTKQNGWMDGFTVLNFCTNTGSEQSNELYNN